MAGLSAAEAELRSELTYAWLSMLESSKGSGNRVATMLSDADVAQLSRKHSRLVQQSARDPALAGETDFPRWFMTAV